jgi:hypothetical protein
MRPDVFVANGLRAGVVTAVRSTLVGVQVARAVTNSPHLQHMARLGAYEAGAALFNQSNVYRGDMGLLARPQQRMVHSL